jgi:AcrR family transcriptional regulator
MPKAFTEHERNLIRQRLLTEGYRCFSAFGIRKSSVEDLAAAAGISKGAFYAFYQSKEALFMDVMEELVEKPFRSEMMAAIEKSEGSPRARLLAVFRKGFSLLGDHPILFGLAGREFDHLLLKVPRDTLEVHLAGDRQFFDELVNRCLAIGIPIQVEPEEMIRLLYALVAGRMHVHDFGGEELAGTSEVLLELVAAYCLGEIELQAGAGAGPDSDLVGGR